MRRPLALVVTASLVGILSAATGLALVATATPLALPAHPGPAATAASLLASKIADTVPNAAQLRRGQYLVALGDCMSCHTRAGGEPLAGGAPLKTPFGVIYTPNITGDRTTGIGGWTGDQFYGAMHDGIVDGGTNLYPAFPYPWYRAIDRAGDDAILAYLKTTPAVNYRPPSNALRFPFNFRFLVKGWNLLFLKDDPVRLDASRSAEWNRGAYLVAGPGHCSACHSPRNLLGADQAGRALQGGMLEDWVAPDLTGNERSGLGRWTVDDVTEYLRTGRNGRAGAGTAMAEVVAYSTSRMTDADRHAIAIYLKALGPTAVPESAEPEPGAMRRGGAIYSDACASCHLDEGVGQPRIFPPLGNNAMLQQADATGLAHIILSGSRIAVTEERPTPLTMPSFAWKLTDAEVADVSTFIRNSWGNRASPVTADAVRALRKRLDASPPQRSVDARDR